MVRGSFRSLVIKILSVLSFLELKVVAKDCTENDLEQRQIQNERDMPYLSPAFG
jgi:hypothetical protein